mmetsp:Transcript_124/g.435  ORF Transcript_124/g.435 Transcript_124/m.435 type:complete len:250 (-) Transcript_124:796-1545(-)
MRSRGKPRARWRARPWRTTSAWRGSSASTKSTTRRSTARLRSFTRANRGPRGAIGGRETTIPRRRKRTSSEAPNRARAAGRGTAAFRAHEPARRSPPSSVARPLAPRAARSRLRTKTWASWASAPARARRREVAATPRRRRLAFDSPTCQPSGLTRTPERRWTSAPRTSTRSRASSCATCTSGPRTCGGTTSRAWRLPKKFCAKPWWRRSGTPRCSPACCVPGGASCCTARRARGRPCWRKPWRRSPGS